MTELHQKIETRLKNLIVNKDQSLADLIYDLGYEYDNEFVDTLFSGWTENQKLLVKQITRLGYHGEFSIFWVRLNSNKLIKSTQRTVINLINRIFPYNLIIFSDQDDTIWDFVNIKAVKDEASDDDKEPKKRQYIRRIRIDHLEQLRTAVERISMLKVPEQGIHHFELQKQHDEAFDVEKLNKEFYNHIALQFTKLVGGKRKIGSRTQDFDALLKLPSITDHKKMQEFAVRLIGRLVFCWFLKKKESGNKNPLIPETILSKKSINSNYYHDVLEPLFFEVLNKLFENRIDEYKAGGWQDIPFLNGGLFEPSEEDFYDTDDLIHKSIYLNTLVIPDSWFNELFEIFESYNFTIEENTSIDIDLSIDPEILGRIFENLLAEINPETGETARKNTGSYYTPRPIVEYMVDESLKQFLLTNTNLEEVKITNLLDYSTEGHTLTDIEKNAVIDVLDEIKIIDPACGSGAFPMGILQKMLLILQKVDPESREWLIKQLDRIPDDNLRREAEEKLKSENMNYIHKLGIIQNSIYGVDIQPIAVEISKLRFFLSLIVDGNIDDDKPNRGLKPLPNLEFKFVCANSLIGLPESENIGIQEGIFKDTFFEDFNREVHNYFNASEPEEKHMVREKIEALIDKKTQQKFEDIQSLHKRITADPILLKKREHEAERLIKLMTLWESYKNLFKNEPVGFFEIQYFFPECKDGFDVVIANPPYGADLSNDQKTYLKNKYDYISERIRNSYLYFIGLGAILSKTKGIVNYIVPNEFLFQIYMTKARKYFLNNYTFKYVVNFGEGVFDAIVPSCIIEFKKEKCDSYPIEISDLRNITFKELDIYLRNSRIEKTSNDMVLETVNSAFTFNLKNTSLVNRLIKDKKSFNDYCITVSNGICTSYDDVYIIDESLAISLNFEKDYLRPCIRGGQMSRYYLPDNTGDNILYVTMEFDKNKGKQILQYLDGHRKLLIRKCVEKNKGSRPWHILFRARKKELFITPKLLFRQTGDSIIATLDEKVNYYPINSINIGILKEGLLRDRKYLLGLLNSKLITFVYREISQEGGRVLAEVKPQRIRALPIAFPDKNKRDNIERIVEQIILAKEINPESNTNELEREIDGLVYEFYGLKKDEIKLIEESV